MKYVCSEEVEGYFLVYSSLISIAHITSITKNVFKGSEKLLFSLFIINQYSKANFLIRRIFFSLFINNQPLNALLQKMFVQTEW